MTTSIGPLPEDIKDEIIATQPNGIWLVLAEEQASDIVTAEDLFSSGDADRPPTAHTLPSPVQVARRLSFRQPTGSISSGCTFCRPMLTKAP